MSEFYITVSYEDDLSKEDLLFLSEICKKKKQLINDIESIKKKIKLTNEEIEAQDCIANEIMNTNTNKISIGKKKFNMDPKKGIEYLIENKILERSEEDVAMFLFKGEGLSKTAIGDYFGERNDFNIGVLKKFISLNNFSGKTIVHSLRQFLGSFRLPGEAQKIDRILELFAQKHWEQNPDIFKSSDTCYVLSFSIIMLNTSLHNPSVKDKPTLEQFIIMNRGLNDGENLPRDLLENIYDDIKNTPFKIPQDDGSDLMHTFFNPIHEGWLYKQGGRVKNWKKRWFILNDNCLYYFETVSDKKPKGIIPLENIQVREINSNTNRPFCFEILSKMDDVIKACKTDSYGKVVESNHNVFKISANSASERDDWIKSIRSSISDNPFYTLLSNRRKIPTFNY